MFAMQHDRFVGKLMDHAAPELIVVLHEFNAWTRPLCAAAQRRGVPVLSFLEGLLYETLPKGMLAAKMSSRVCLWGQAHRRRLLNEGSDAHRLVITGPVHLDELRKAYLPRRSEFADRLGLGDGRPVVLTIVPRLCFWPHAQAILASLAHYAKRHPQWHFAIKWHPHEKQDDITTLAIDTSAVTSFQTEDTLQLITCADAIVSGGTTAGGEALAFDKPLIEINWHGRNVNLDYARHGVCETVADENDWLAIERVIVNGPSVAVQQATTEYLADNFYRLDGRCLDRVLAAAAPLLRGVL
jgi:UDP-N-acetylglucosamine 2-epimerase